jgi:hypothetical protein
MREQQEDLRGQTLPNRDRHQPEAKNPQRARNAGRVNPPFLERHPDQHTSRSRLTNASEREPSNSRSTHVASAMDERPCRGATQTSDPRRDLQTTSKSSDGWLPWSTAQGKVVRRLQYQGRTILLELKRPGDSAPVYFNSDGERVNDQRAEAAIARVTASSLVSTDRTRAGLESRTRDQSVNEVRHVRPDQRRGYQDADDLTPRQGRNNTRSSRDITSSSIAAPSARHSADGDRRRQVSSAARPSRRRSAEDEEVVVDSRRHSAEDGERDQTPRRRPAGYEEQDRTSRRHPAKDEGARSSRRWSDSEEEEDDDDNNLQQRFSKLRPSANLGDRRR